MDPIRRGTRIRLIAMPNDPDPIPPGSEGTVVDVTDGPLGQVTVDWDNSTRTLALIPGVDVFEVIEPTPTAGSKTTEPGYGRHPICSSCPWKRTVTVFDPQRAVTVSIEVYDGIEAVRLMGAVDLSQRAAFARVARRVGFRAAAAWIEDGQNRASWEQGIRHGFRVEMEERHGKRRRNRP